MFRKIDYISVWFRSVLDTSWNYFSSSDKVHMVLCIFDVVAGLHLRRPHSWFLILPLCFQLLFFEVLVFMLGMEVTVAWWKFVILENEIRDTQFAMPQLCFDFIFFRYLNRCVSTRTTATIYSTTATYLDFFVIF